MLSKSTGQILRVAACFNMLFRIRDSTEPWPENNPEDKIIHDAIKAACDFVDICCIHTAFMAGRSTSLSKTQELKTSDENFFLVFPGSVLILSDIINARRFKSRGKKDEAVTALTALQNDGLGTLSDLPSSKHSAHTAYQFTKAKVPDSPEGKEKFAAALMKHGVSLEEYVEAFQKPNFVHAPPSKKKRAIIEPGEQSKTKKSKEVAESDED
ncbi:uncharacterized protein [Dysidea avara]|uniref:uncharacterized protein n=1 Tax=Dysidea avara TaxID=196820 RepID=UPI003323BF33